MLFAISTRVRPKRILPSRTFIENFSTTFETKTYLLIHCFYVPDTSPIPSILNHLRDPKEYPQFQGEFAAKHEFDEITLQGSFLRDYVVHNSYINSNQRRHRFLHKE